MKRTELFVLILILAVAAGFRLYHLDSVPPGVSLEEASNGLTATQVAETGHPHVYYTDNGGKEGLLINLQALSIHFFGTTAFALRLVAALAGIFTVLGTYLLARRLFDNWELSAIAAFLMAVGSWHVLFSRLGLVAVISPLCAVWGLYYLYKGIETTRLWPWLMAGFWLGLEFHTTIGFHLMPAVVGIVILSYLYALRTDFRHDKFAHIRHQLWGSMAVMVAVMVIVFLPVAAYLYANPAAMTTNSSATVFAGDRPVHDLIQNKITTFAMFAFTGDKNQEHGIPAEPLLLWPLGALFIVGILRSGYKILRTWSTHGHPSIVHVLLLSWFGIGLIPAVLSRTGVPDASLALIVAPAVYIITGQGLWWLYVWFLHWYGQRDVHQICLPGPRGHQWCVGEGKLVVGFTVIVFLLAMGVADANRYFVQWANDPKTAAAFNAEEVRVAARISALPPATLKYIVVTRETSAWPIMYLSNTGTPEKQTARNTFYLTTTQFRNRQYRPGAVIIKLNP